MKICDSYQRNEGISPSLKTVQSIIKVNEALGFCTAALSIGYFSGHVSPHIFQTINAGMLTYSSILLTAANLYLNFGECSWIRELTCQSIQELSENPSPNKIEETGGMISTAFRTSKLCVNFLNLISLGIVAPIYPKLTASFLGLAGITAYSSGIRIAHEIEKHLDISFREDDGLSSIAVQK